MYDEILDNPKATRVRKAAALARKKERVAQGRFLVEGPQAVRELLAHKPELADAVYVVPGDEGWQRELGDLASDVRVRIEPVTAEVLATMCETVQPQGIVAIARTWESYIEDALEGARLVAVMHEVRDPGNAGAVLRAADAAGADVVIFAGDSIDPFHPKVVRSTTGSLFHLPVIIGGPLADVVAACRAAGLETLAADVRGSDLLEARAEGALDGAVAWVFGNEARGLSEEDRELVGRSLKLPIYGAAESLNLATAASVLLYETAFAQRS